MISPRFRSGTAIAAALFLLSVLPLAGQTNGRFRVTTREVWHFGAAFAPDGRLTVAWSGLDTTGKPGLFTRHFTRTGEALGSEMRVSYRRAEGRVSVAPLAQDGFAVAWTLPGQGLALRRFDAQGVPLGPESLVAPGADADGAIHALAEGGFVAVWTAPARTGGQRVSARRYSSSGAPQGVEVAFETLATGTFRGVTVGPGASLLVTREAADTSVCSVIARRYSLEGRPLGKAFSICSASPEPVVSAGKGSFVTAWARFGGVYMRRLALNGAPLGPTSRVDTTGYDGAGALPGSSPKVALSPAGTFAVLWRLKPCNVDCSEFHMSDLTAWNVYSPAGTLWAEAGSQSYPLFCEPGEDDQDLTPGPGSLFAALWLRTCWHGPEGADFTLSGAMFSAAPPAPPPPPPLKYPGGLLSLDKDIYGAREEQGTLTVRVRRTGGTGLVGVGYSAGGGSARPSVDYVPVSGRLIWRDGDFADKTFSVPILADGVTEPSSFYLSLREPAGGAGISRSGAMAYIDSPGVLGFAWDQTTVLESAGKVDLQVRRLGGSRGAVSIQYYSGLPPDSDVEPGLATEGEDYWPVAGTLRWKDGDDAPKTIAVPIVDDGEIENWEGFCTSLAGPTGGAVLGGSYAYHLSSWNWSVIEDDEISLASPGWLALDLSSPLTVGERDEVAYVGVQRTGGMAGRVSVRYTVTAGTAKPGVDFTPVSGVLVWGDSDPFEQAFAIPILNDHQAEGNETVKIELSAPTGGATLGIPSAAVLTILDDDR